MSSRADVAAKKKADKAARMAAERQVSQPTLEAPDPSPIDVPLPSRSTRPAPGRSQPLLLLCQALQEGSATAAREAAEKKEQAHNNSWAASAGREGQEGWQLGDGLKTVFHTVGTEGAKIQSTKTALTAGGRLVGKGIEGAAWAVGATAHTAGSVIQKVVTKGKDGKRVAKPGMLSQNTSQVAGFVADKASMVTEVVVGTTEAVVGTVGAKTANLISSTGTVQMLSEGEGSAATRWVTDVVEGATEGIQSIKGSTAKGYETVAAEGKSAAVGVAQHTYGRKVAKEVGKTADGVATVGRSSIKMSHAASSGMELAKDIAKETAKQLQEQTKATASELEAAAAEGEGSQEAADGAALEVQQ